VNRNDRFYVRVESNDAVCMTCGAVVHMGSPLSNSQPCMDMLDAHEEWHQKLDWLMTVMQYSRWG
jgi:hypothetical protein